MRNLTKLLGSGLCALGLFVDSLRSPSKHRWARFLLVLMTVVMLADALGRWWFS